MCYYWLKGLNMVDLFSWKHIGIGYFKPSMKNWRSFVLGMALMVPYVLFNCQVLGASEDMYLFAPAIEGTPLYW